MIRVPWWLALGWIVVTCFWMVVVWWAQRSRDQFAEAYEVMHRAFWDLRETNQRLIDQNQDLLWDKARLMWQIEEDSK